MRLHRIRVEHVRGLSAAEIELAPAGVTVIEAPNESGKTTLFDALDHLLTEKDSTRKQPVRDLQPVGRDVGSLVEAQLTCGEVQLTIRKRFNKDRMTELELHAPEPRSYTGDEAHDQLRRILGERTDIALYEALRFRQGRPLDSLVLSGSNSLAARLDEIAGGLGDSADDVLRDRIREEFTRYFTPSGQPGRRLKESHADLQAGEEQVAELLDAAQAIQRDAEELTDLEGERRRLSDTIAELEPTLDEHRARSQRVRAVREELATRQMQAQLAEVAVERALAAVGERGELVAAAAQRRDDVGRRAPLVEQARDRLKQLQSDLDARAAALVAAEEAEREERRQLAAVRAAIDVRRLRDELQALTERQERVDAALEAAATAEAALEARQLTDEQLAEIRAADDASRIAEARLGDAAPVLALHALADVDVSLDGVDEQLAAGASAEHPVPDRTVVRVSDLIEVEVRAGSSLSERQAELALARQRLRHACDAVAVPDRASAERLEDERRTHLGVIQERDAALARELVGSTRDQLADRIRTCATRLRQCEERLAEESTGDAAAPVEGEMPTGGSPPQLTLDVAVAADQLAVRETAEAEAREWAEQARREHTGLSQEVGRLRSEVEVAAAELAADERQLEEQRARLVAVRAETSDEGLHAALDEAQRAAVAAHDAVAATREVLEQLGADEVELLAGNAELALNRAREDLARVRERIVQRQSRIEVRGGEGIGERLLAAEAERDRVRDAHERLVARAEAARALAEAFERARDAAYAAYRQPLRERVTRNGRVVFGDTLDVELDEELRIVTRQLHGVTLDWDQLSAGAREQLAILMALAAADLAGGDGASGVPLVLDDTLGYTDPRRLERLCAVLGRVRGPQVIVLTCVGARFQAVGDATVVRLREDGDR